MADSISVVIPTCDRPELLCQAVQSVLGQSSLPLEIIIVDNGLEPVDVNGIPGQVRLVSLPCRCGVSRARNQGVMEARGSYVAFLDDDDLWPPDYLEHMAKALGKDRADMLVGRVDVFDEDMEPKPWKFAGGQLKPEVLLVRNPGVVGSNTVVLKESFLKIGGYDESLTVSEDKSLALDMLDAGMRLSCVAEARILQRRHSLGRLTGTTDMAAGLIGFMDKYRARMTPGQRRYNALKIAMHAYHSKKSPARLMRYMWGRLWFLMLGKGEI